MNKGFDYSKPPLVAETLLKKRRSLEELAIVRSINVSNEVKRRRVVRGENVKIRRPEDFVKRRVIRDNSSKKLKRKTRAVNMNRMKKIAKPTVGFAIRVLGGKNTSNKVKDALQELGLNAKYDGVFLKLHELTLAKLKPLEDYIAYGYISNKMVEELVHRRAFYMDGENKLPLSDNLIVEQLLGAQGILCLADLSREIFNVGENFDSAVELLAPFKLSAPAGQFEKKTLHLKADERRFLDGEKMEQFLSKIL